MGSLFNDKDIEWAETDPEYVLKKQRLVKNWRVSDRKHMFHQGNLDGEWKSGKDFCIGVNKESWAVTKEDEEFIDYQHKVNLGGRRGHWRDDLPLDILLDLEMCEEIEED